MVYATLDTAGGRPPKDVQVLCGTKAISWDTLQAFTRAVEFSPTAEDLLAGDQSGKEGPFVGCRTIHIVTTCRVLMSDLKWGLPLGMLPGIMCRRQSTVPADKVFGTMGLLARNTRSHISIDTS